MKNKNDQIPKKIKKIFTKRILLSINTVLLIVAIALFWVGAANLNGKTVNIVEAFTMSFEFLQSFEPTYENISGMCLGIIYIIITILLVKKLISVLKHFFHLQFKDKRFSNEALFSAIQNHTGHCYVGMFFAAMCCNICGNAGYHIHMAVMIVLAFVSLILWKSIYAINKNYHISTILIETACLLFFLIPLFLTAWFSQNSVVEETTKKVSEFIEFEFDYFSTRDTVIDFIYKVFDVLVQFFYFVIALLLITVYEKVNMQSIFENKKIKRFIKAIIIIPVSLCVISFVLFMIDGGTITIKNLIYIWKPYIPLVFTGVALYIATFFYDQIVIEKKEKQTV